MDTDVLIVGAGPTGLAIAAVLAKYGTRFRIVDAGRGLTDLSKAIGIQARTLETLDIIGCADKLIERGNKIKAFRLYDDSTKIIDMDFMHLRCKYPYLLIVPQSDTEAVLHDSMVSSGVVVEHDTVLMSFTQNSKYVEATIRCKGDKQETIRSHWLIGCDGAHSVVRHSLGFPFTGDEYPESFMLADLNANWDKPRDEVFLYLHDGWIVAFFPLPNNNYRIIADLPPDKAPLDKIPALDDCKRIIKERVPGTIDISDMQWASYYRIHRRIVPRLRDRRVFLVGDSAHIHSPAGAQGMNTGIQDAVNLAWKLAFVEANWGDKKLASPASIERMLDSYHTERFPVEQAVLSGTDMLIKMATVKQPAMRKLRDIVLPIISHMQLFQDRATNTVSELRISYHDSSITKEHDIMGGPKAGDRAPDGELIGIDNKIVRIYEMLRDGKLLILVFLPKTNDLHKIYAALDPIKPLVNCCYIMRNRDVIDNNELHVYKDAGSVFQTYGIHMTCIRILRPDGYIAMRSDIFHLEKVVAELKDIYGF